MEKNYKDILLEAADLLEQEGRWGKRRFFNLDNPAKPCVMCAHGAIAYCGNPKVRDIILNRNEMLKVFGPAAAFSEIETTDGMRTAYTVATDSDIERWCFKTANGENLMKMKLLECR